LFQLQFGLRQAAMICKRKSLLKEDKRLIISIRGFLRGRGL